jgi:uncharacterized protein (TIGR02271 family)
MKTLEDVQAWRGLKAVGIDGEKLGTIDEIYLDRRSGEPEWVTVSTGLFGARTSFVPIADADAVDEEVRLPYSKEQIKAAPNIDADDALSAEEEQRLYAHYGRDDHGEWDGRDATGDDLSGPTTDDAMTRSEEELRVGTTERESGRVRLRKYVVTEDVNTTVPVKREEVRLEREPITDANRDAATSGAEISEEEHELVLHEEEVVVDKRAVPKERVRLNTDTVTEEHEVSETVRKEQVETLDADGQPREGVDGVRGTDEGVSR